MKRLSISQQKLLKSIHLVTAGIWMTCILLLALLPLLSKDIIDGEALYMYNRVYHFVDIMIVSPAAFFTLLTGLLYSLFTHWGFFKHGWLIYKWIITLGLITTGTFYLGPMVKESLAIVEVKKIAALADPSYIDAFSLSVWVAPFNATLLVLAFIVSVYKPWKKIKD